MLELEEYSPKDMVLDLLSKTKSRKQNKTILAQSSVKYNSESRSKDCLSGRNYKHHYFTLSISSQHGLVDK